MNDTVIFLYLSVGILYVAVAVARVVYSTYLKDESSQKRLRRIQEEFPSTLSDEGDELTVAGVHLGHHFTVHCPSSRTERLTAQVRFHGPASFTGRGTDFDTLVRLGPRARALLAKHSTTRVNQGTITITLGDDFVQTVADMCELAVEFERGNESDAAARLLAQEPERFSLHSLQLIEALIAARKQPRLVETFLLSRVNNAVDLTIASEALTLCEAHSLLNQDLLDSMLQRAHVVLLPRVMAAFAKLKLAPSDATLDAILHSDDIERKRIAAKEFKLGGEVSIPKRGGEISLKR